MVVSLLAVVALTHAGRALADGAGIGVELTKREGSVVIASVAEGSWADRAGVEPGDILVKANGLTVDPSALGNAVAALATPDASASKLSLKRNGESMQISVDHSAPVGVDGDVIASVSVDAVRQPLFSAGTLAAQARATLAYYDAEWFVPDASGRWRHIESGQLYPIAGSAERTLLKLQFKRQSGFGSRDELAGTYVFHVEAPSQSISEADINLSRDDLKGFATLQNRSVKLGAEGAILTYGGGYRTLETPRPTKYIFEGPRDASLWIQRPGTPLQSEVGQLPVTTELLKGDELSYSLRMQDGHVLQGLISVKADMEGHFKPSRLPFPDNGARDIEAGKTITPFFIYQGISKTDTLTSVSYERGDKDSESLAGISAALSEDVGGIVRTWVFDPGEGVPTEFQLVSIEDQPVHSLGQARAILGGLKIGGKAKLTVRSLQTPKADPVDVMVLLKSRALVAPGWPQVRGRGIL